MLRTTVVLMALTPVLAPAAPPSKDVTPAPVPAQIGAARKVFIANGGMEYNPNGQKLGVYGGGPDRSYDQFYAAMKSWGRYELAGSPGDADLVLEISFSNPTVSWAGLFTDPQLRLVIADPRTRVPLWTFIRHLEIAGRQENRDKNFDKAMDDIVASLKNLDARAAAQK